MSTVNDNAPGLIYSDKVVFSLSEATCSEGKACSLARDTLLWAKLGLQEIPERTNPPIYPTLHYLTIS
jgi:hypothetical protein